jgi:hypothetical protein
MRRVVSILSRVVVVGVLAGCSAVPRVELTAYTSAYAEVLTITNGILDIVVPYERMVIRTAGRTSVLADVPAIAFAEVGEPELAARAQVIAQAAPDPSLIKKKKADPDESLIKKKKAEPDDSLIKKKAQPDDSLIIKKKAQPDDSLIIKKKAQPDDSLIKRKAEPDKSLITKKAQPDLGLIKRKTPPTEVEVVVPAGDPRPVVVVEEPVVIPGPPRPVILPFGRRCTGVGGPDPFCYERRDGYADIGDPPLVGAYRNLANVVLRFNTLLIAYSDGISGRLLQQELAGLSASVSELSQMAPITNITGAGAFAASFSGVVTSLAPIANLAGGVYDRAQLRVFLLENYDLVDQAIALMARGSPELYANVSVGTELFRRQTPPGTGGALLSRRKEIRRLIANWTVLLDDTRRLLRELKVAIEVSDGLETRMHNLEATIRARIDTSAIKKQIATLGTPSLGP